MFENLDNPQRIATWEGSAWRDLEPDEDIIVGGFFCPPAKKSKHRSSMHGPRPMRRLMRPPDGRRARRLAR